MRCRYRADNTAGRRLAGLSLSGAGAAVDGHDRAGHHRGPVAEQPRGHLGDLAGLGHPAERDRCVDALRVPGAAASHASIISVAVPPGVMPFTRMPSRAQLTAAVSVMLLSARFIAP